MAVKYAIYFRVKGNVGCDGHIFRDSWTIGQSSTTPLFQLVDFPAVESEIYTRSHDKRVVYRSTFMSIVDDKVTILWQRDFKL